MSVGLTKDTDKFLCVLYKEYLERRKKGESKRDSKYFSSEYIQRLFPDQNQEDCMESARELKKAFDVSIDIVGGISLSDETVIYMENRFPEGLSQLLDILGKFKNAIPFV